MMRLILTFIILLSCSLFARAQNASVTVKGSIADTLYFTAYERVPFGKKAFSHYVLDAHAKTEHTFTIPDSVCNKRLYLSCNKNFTFLELKPGQHLNIELNGYDMKFTGDTDKINQYLYDWVQQCIMSFSNAFKFRLQIRNYFHNYKNFLPKGIFTKEAQDKLESLNKIALKQLRKSGIKDKVFVEQQTIWLKYLEYQVQLHNYVYLKQNNPTKANEYGKQIKQHKFNSGDLLQHPNADFFLINHFLIQEEVYNIKRIIPQQVSARAASLKSAELQEYYVLKQLKRLVVSQNGFMLDHIVENASQFITSEQGKKELEKLQPAINKLLTTCMRGENAYEFEFEDVNGKLVSLKDFRGKYVFLDIWATWCGPCQMNLPYVAKLEEKLHGENIAFVSISVDKQKDKQKWIDFVKTTPINGTALIANNAFKDEIIKFYGIRGIPRFILIDPQGKIVSARCRQPMDLGFREYLVNFITNQLN